VAVRLQAVEEFGDQFGPALEAVGMAGPELVEYVAQGD